MNRHQDFFYQKGAGCILAGIALLLAAFVLILYNIHEGVQAGAASKEVLVVLEEKIEPQQDGDEKTIGEDISDMVESKELVTIIDGNYYIGVLEIPDLELVLPVISELDEVKLKTAPCRYSGSYYTDDMVISGHNYAQHFKYIKNMALGSKLTFTALDGVEISYKVVARDIVGANEVEKMVTGDWDLTLFTCTNDRLNRFALRCEREK